MWVCIHAFLTYRSSLIIPKASKYSFLSPGRCKMTHQTLRKNISDTAFIAFKSSKCLSLCINILYCYRNTYIINNGHADTPKFFWWKGETQKLRDPKWYRETRIILFRKEDWWDRSVLTETKLNGKLGGGGVTTRGSALQCWAFERWPQAWGWELFIVNTGW